jgi:hypothetical protein
MCLAIPSVPASPPWAILVALLAVPSGGMWAIARRRAPRG